MRKRSAQKRGGGRGSRPASRAASRKKTVRAARKNSKAHPTSQKPTARPVSRKRAPRAVRAPKIRIVVADDQAMDRKGLIALLESEPDFQIVGEAVQAEEAARQCQDLSPSVLILSLRMSAPEGKTALSVIRSTSPETPVLAVAERGEGHCMVLNPPRAGRTFALNNGDECASGTDCLQLAVFEGATGTIRRSASPEELFRAIRTVASGKAWYESGTASAIMRHALARRGNGGVRSLSDRETQVAELIADGRSNKEIAQALKISEPTVKKHVGHILGKLKLQDRLQIGLYVARNPLVLRQV